MTLLSRIRQLLRRGIDAAARRTYEGPLPPQRLGDELLVWLAHNPDASREAIAGVAIVLIESGYRDGFLRGMAWQSNGWVLGLPPPDARAHAYERPPEVERLIADGFDRRDPLASMTPADRALTIRILRHGGTFR